MKKPSALVAAVALILSACSGPTGETDGPLIVYSGRSEELVQPLIDLPTLYGVCECGEHQH